MIETVHELEDRLSEPSEKTVASMAALEGDFLLLGAAGKMGPTLAMMLAKSCRRAGLQKTITAVSRFSNNTVKKRLEETGIAAIECDLLEKDAVEKLPDAENVIFLAGMKFGATGKEPLTWAMNTYVPAVAARRYRNSRITALSTGNVYPFVTPDSGGSRETDPPGPVGEYAQSCLGRERIFQYFSEKNSTPVAIIRLNYATEPRYGVLVDIAQKVIEGRPINLDTGYVNVIWQADANMAIIQSLAMCSVPPAILNLAGTEIISVRKTAEEFGRIFGKNPVFENTESATALLSNPSLMCETIGPPDTCTGEMIEMTARWLAAGKPTLNRPTHFQAKNGRF